MRNAGQFLHPKLVDSLSSAGHFNQLCTIQRQMDDSTNSIGEPIDGDDNWEGIEGMIDIPCLTGVPRSGMLGRELNATSSTYHQSELIVFLEGFFPDIHQEHRAIIDGTKYNISTFGHVRNKRFTWLAVDRTD